MVHTMNFKQDILKALAPHVGVDEYLIEIPPDPAMGDFALPCFSFAKQLKKAPHQIAEDLVKAITIVPPIEKIEIKGAYLNFFLNPREVAKRVLCTIHDQDNAFGMRKEKKKIMIEYPSPNTNKPLHLGHLRNMLIGASVAKMYRFMGNTVIEANLNNDRGIHICRSEEHTSELQSH